MKFYLLDSAVDVVMDSEMSFDDMLVVSGSFVLVPFWVYMDFIKALIDKVSGSDSLFPMDTLDGYGVYVNWLLVARVVA